MIEQHQGTNGQARESELWARMALGMQTGDLPSLRATLDALERVRAGDSARWPRREARDLLAPLPPMNWLVEALDFAPGGPPAMIAGYGYSGKTAAAQALAIAVAGGVPLWGRWPVRRGRVLHLDYEQGFRLTAERYQRLARAADLTVEDLRGRLEVVCYPPTYIDGTGAEDAFARELDGHDLVIVDSFRAAAPSTDENDSMARLPLDMLARVSERSGCLALVLHHSRKPQHERGSSHLDTRGSSALFDALSAELMFSAAKGQPTRVELVKAKWTGRQLAPFVLRIEDVSDGADPRGGMRVTVEDADAADEKARQTELDAVTSVVLEVVRANPGTNTRTVCELAHRRHGSVVAALGVLERAGAVRDLSVRGRGAKWYPAPGNHKNPDA
jgi:hypothetical protein